jgi:small subunit ribosomal protein S25e
VKEECAYLYL